LRDHDLASEGLGRVESAKRADREKEMEACIVARWGYRGFDYEVDQVGYRIMIECW